MERTSNRPLAMNELTKEQLDTEIAKGLADIENGRVYSAEEVQEELHDLY